jgi:hypothetical protein
VIFGRRISKHYRGKLQTEIEDMDLPNPVIRSRYGNGFIKQYVRDHLAGLSFPKIRSRRIRKVRQNQRIIVFDGCDAPLDCSSYCQPVQVAAPA